MTLRDAQLLCTALGLPDLRSDLEQADAMARGEDHIREWDPSLLIPGTSPYPDAPVSFNALVDAMELDRPGALQKAKHESFHESIKPSTGGRRKKEFWLTDLQAKRFALSAGISANRKEAIIDYFCRREEEATDYRNLDRQRDRGDDAEGLRAKLEALSRRLERVEKQEAILEKAHAQVLKENKDVRQENDELVEHWIEIQTAFKNDSTIIAKELGWINRYGRPAKQAVCSVIILEDLVGRGGGSAWAGLDCDSLGRVRKFDTGQPRTTGRVNDVGMMLLRIWTDMLKAQGICHVCTIRSIDPLTKWWFTIVNDKAPSQKSAYTFVTEQVLTDDTIGRALMLSSKGMYSP